LKKCNTYISMNKLILTGLLAAGAMTHIQGAQFAGQENQQQDPKDKSQRPNILFILSDDHTSQAWGIYGGVLADYAYNSNIRRLANEGVVLDNCFCTNSISAPSRASILTGLYSHRNGLYTLADSLDTSIPTLATVLQANGYNTGLVGKWHIKSQPQGFDYYSIFYDQGEYRDPTFIESSDPWPGNRPFGERVPGFSTDLVAEKAINWIKQQDSNQPFLMCCHFKATHEPYDYPTRMEHLYDGVTFPEPENFLDWGPETNGRSFQGQTLEELGHRWRVASKDPDKWWCRYPGLPFNTDGMQRTTARRAIYQKLIRDYLRCGATIDDNIGKLLKTLDEMGIADNTIVVYVSDQGYFLGEHGFFDKRMFYEEAARMPFVIRYPKKIPAGKRLKDLILNIDFAPTLAEFAGVKMENVQGHSFTGNLGGKTPADWRKEIYYRYWTNHAIRPAHFAIRSERYKLIFYYAKNLDMTDTENFDFTPAWDFYDLEEDPHENHNLYNDPKYAPIIRQMKKDLLNLRKEVGDTDEKYPEMQELLEKYYK
jgi:arylsulfatase A-like enzyme